MARLLILVTGIFVGVIGFILILAPQSYMSVYAVTYDPAMDFAARRFAPALIGLGVLLLLARGLPNGPFLSQLCLLTGLVFLAVAATGVQAWTSGVATSSILFASCVEVVLTALFVWAARSTSRSE